MWKTADWRKCKLEILCMSEETVYSCTSNPAYIHLTEAQVKLETKFFHMQLNRNRQKYWAGL